MAAPFPILELEAGPRRAALPLAGDAFAYTYRQSIYRVAVREELRVAADAIRIDRAVSADIRALEYFRWPGRPEDAGGGLLAWRAPENAVDHLRILVIAEGEQTIDAGLRRMTFRDAFGDDASVTVRPARRPLLLWLWALLP